MTTLFLYHHTKINHGWLVLISTINFNIAIETKKSFLPWKYVGGSNDCNDDDDDDDDDDDQENLINVAQLEVDVGDKPQKSSVIVLDWNFRKHQWKGYYR